MNDFFNFINFNQLLIFFSNFDVAYFINAFLIFIFYFFGFFSKGFFANFFVNRIKALSYFRNSKFSQTGFDSLKSSFKLIPFIIITSMLVIFFIEDVRINFYLIKINTTLITIFIFWTVYIFLSTFSTNYRSLEVFLSKEIFDWINRSLKFIIFLLGLVAILETWGIKIGPFIAGLGLFGVAIALGAQDLFKNLISGVLIILEKRFKVNDVIELKSHTIGTVEYIGFRSTLVRQFDTTLISIPNYIFSELALINHSKRKYRRLNWIIGLTYDTNVNSLKIVCSDILSFISSSNDFIVNTEFKAIVRLEKFNDSSIDILVHAFTNTSDWENYLKIKENLAFEIKNIVEKNNCTFAFPSRSIYIEKK